jgi:very-short-patch-repair endonuclease
MVRLAAEDAGIPFVPNQWLTSAYRPDGLVDGWLPVEIDGMETHSGAEAVAQDRTRDATIAQFGTPPLRFTQNHAIRETAWVVETIRRVWLRGSAEMARRAGR